MFLVATGSLNYITPWCFKVACEVTKLSQGMVSLQKLVALL